MYSLPRNGKWKCNLKLINEIKRRPVLYNKNAFNGYNHPDDGWEEVAKIMGWTVARCKEKWKHNRDAYQRHIKRFNNGEDLTRLPSYYLMSAMAFALPYMKPYKITGPCQEKRNENNEDEYAQIREETTEYLISDEEQIEDQEQVDTRNSLTGQTSNQESIVTSESPEPSFSFVSEYIPSVNQRIKREVDSQNNSNTAASSKDIQVEISDIIPNLDLKEDAKKMFLLSLLPDVYAMTDAQMRKFKREVSNIIGEILDSDH